MLKIKDIKKTKNNPREMSEEERKALKQSIQTFGDIGGIVYNKKTKQLVGGNHRWEELIKIYPEKSISFSQIGDTEFHLIMSDDDFTGYLMREVDWEEAKAKAANVTANSSLLSGNFTKELDSFLVDIEAGFGLDFMKDLRLDELKLDLKDLDVKLDTKKQKNVDLADDIFDSVEDDDDIDFDFGGEDVKKPSKIELSSKIVIELDGEYDKNLLYDDITMFFRDKNYTAKSISLS